MDKQKILCVVAGKSGGHIVPGMTLAQRSKSTDHKILFFSTNTSLDKTVMASYSIFSYIPLPFSQIPGKKIVRYPIVGWYFIQSFFKSLVVLLRLRPQQIVSMGGAVSLPVCFAGWLLRIPISLYELNAVPGKAIKVLAPLARTIVVCFPQAKAYFKPAKVKEEHYPIRFAMHDKVAQIDARIQLGLDPHRKTLLILGGSQGSRFINELIKHYVALHSSFYQDLQIIHQAGAHDVAELKEFYKTYPFPALVFDYRHDLHLCYSAADKAVARAGAGTLFELAFFGVSSLIIPLQAKTTDHQHDNARAMYELYSSLFTILNQKSIEENPAPFYALLNIHSL